MTGTKPSIQSDHTIAIISFPLKSAVKSSVTPKANNTTNDGVNDDVLSEKVIKVYMALKVLKEHGQGNETSCQYLHETVIGKSLWGKMLPMYTDFSKIIMLEIPVILDSVNIA